MRFSKNMLTKVRSEGSHIINMLTIIVFGEDFGLGIPNSTSV